MSEDEISWVTGVCRGGPLEGKPIYVANELGLVVTFSRRAGDAGGLVYEVAELATETLPAVVLFVSDGE